MGPCKLWPLVAGALMTLGCFSTPTPLAPNVSGSVGVPHHGVQTGATELPKSGPGFVRYRPHSRNYWGRPHLVTAVQDSARRVAELLPGGSPLVVGDLSARLGGKIPGHNSHRTGRDVDLLWYVTTPKGAPLANPGFINVDTDGLAPVHETGDYVRLDVERQWLLVKELMRSPHIDVQWMFCSRSVEALLIDYARARGEDLELIWHAQTVLLQPGDSLPHDDHIHLRVACTQEEAVNGCLGGGPYWNWLPPLPSVGPLGHDFLEQLGRQFPVNLATSDGSDRLSTHVEGDHPARGLFGATLQPERLWLTRL